MILCLILAGCQTLGKKETFAVCKTADIATTAYALHNGIGHEANPAAAKMMTHGYFPLIAIGFLTYKALERVNSPGLNRVANVVVCGAAVNNTAIILRGE